jgi:UDP-N-acetylglucosamine diphosphorylase/glucosamine-1-phosphate N-acetyltransferase
MEKIVFTEKFCSPEKLFPFTLTRRIQDIRVGILTIREKWENYLGYPSFDKDEEDYKDTERSIVIDETIGKDIIYLIHGNVLPTPELIKQVKKLKPGTCLSMPEKENFVYCISQKQITDGQNIKIEKAIDFTGELDEIRVPWDILKLNAPAIKTDFHKLSGTRKGQAISSTNKIVNPKNIFIEKGAHVEHCFLNAFEGPIYIEKGSTVMEGAAIRGPVGVCANAVVKMGSRIYGATTVGPNCIVGGEIKNSVFFSNSNKAHDGYLGDSVIGEWCNLGAGTTNSNVKNNASNVKVYTPEGMVDAGLKCGVMIGDYSRTAINTSINTGTVIGVCSNVFGNGLTPKYIPSFSWGSDGIQRYEFDKALAHIDNWKKMKGQQITDAETSVLNHIFDHY